eukprot:5314642-Amphidinium_carterae.1
MAIPYVTDCKPRTSQSSSGMVRPKSNSGKNANIVCSSNSGGMLNNSGKAASLNTPNAVTEQEVQLCQRVSAPLPTIVDEPFLSCADDSHWHVGWVVLKYSSAWIDVLREPHVVRLEVISDALLVAELAPEDIDFVEVPMTHERLCTGNGRGIHDMSSAKIAFKYA